MKKIGLMLVVAPLFLAGCAIQNTQNDHLARSPGMKVEDNSLEASIHADLIAADARYRDANINITSYNGLVLLTGQVPSEELRNKALDVARQARHARHVYNQLNVSANLRIFDKAQDAWLTAQARALLLKHKLSHEGAVEASRIHIMTENQSMYLMGIVTQAEGDEIVRVLSGIGGVKKLTKVFDYLD